MLLAIVALTACAAHPNPLAGQPPEGVMPAGFWLGLWHGVISPITFWVSLFADRVAVYDVVNTGHWYDFGFGVGVTIIVGGSRHARRRAKPDKVAPVAT